MLSCKRGQPGSSPPGGHKKRGPFSLFLGGGPGFGVTTSLGEIKEGARVRRAHRTDRPVAVSTACLSRAELVFGLEHLQLGWRHPPGSGAPGNPRRAYKQQLGTSDCLAKLRNVRSSESCRIEVGLGAPAA